MWWTCVVLQRHQAPEQGIMLGSFNADLIGSRRAKKAAKALGKEYIRHGGPGQPRLIESPLIMEGSSDMTWTETGEMAPETEGSGTRAGLGAGWARGEQSPEPVTAGHSLDEPQAPSADRPTEAQTSDEELLGELLDEVLATPEIQAPGLFVDRVRSTAVDLQRQGASVERMMMGTFNNVRANSETQGLSDGDLWQVVASVYAQLIREGSLRR